jgi:hypothetical protein
VTVDQMIKKHPWMEFYRNQLHEKCGDCQVELGQRHHEGCDVARCTKCGGQRLGCGCKKGRTDEWTGILYPALHKKCVEHDLWQRSWLIYKGAKYPVDQHSNMGFLFAVATTGVYNPGQFHILPLDDDKSKVRAKSPYHDEIFEIDSETMRRFCEAVSSDPAPRVEIKMHDPCNRDDEGADADLNRAAVFRPAAENYEPPSTSQSRVEHP